MRLHTSNRHKIKMHIYVNIFYSRCVIIHTSGTEQINVH